MPPAYRLPEACAVGTIPTVGGVALRARLIRGGGDIQPAERVAGAGGAAECRLLGGRIAVLFRGRAGRRRYVRYKWQRLPATTDGRLPETAVPSSLSD